MHGAKERINLTYTYNIEMREEATFSVSLTHNISLSHTASVSQRHLHTFDALQHLSSGTLQVSSVWRVLSVIVVLDLSLIHI